MDISYIIKLNFITDEFVRIIEPLCFVPTELGEQIDSFNFVDPNHENLFSAILNKPVFLPKNWGIFRKSNSTIHFDDHNNKTLYSAIIALEDQTYTRWKHKELNFESVYDFPDNFDIPTFIQENCSNEENWEVIDKITIKKNSLFFYQPWFWHSFSSGIQQKFTVELKTEA